MDIHMSSTQLSILRQQSTNNQAIRRAHHCCEQVLSGSKVRGARTNIDTINQDDGAYEL